MMYRKSSRRQRVALIALLAATATVITLDFQKNPGGPIRRVQEVAVAVVAPLQDGISSVFRPVGEFLSSLSEIKDLRKENAALEAKVKKQEDQLRRFPELQRENTSLRELTQLKDWTAGKTLGARVIGVGPSNHEWTAFLDKGTDDGLREGMSVVAQQGLVGRIVFAAKSYSNVLMLIDPKHSAGARLTTSGDTGSVTGRGEDDLLFRHIEPVTEVQVGEAVVTSGYDRGIFPSGIPIGRVSSTQKSRDGLTKTARVTPFVDFKKLDSVLVLLESGPVDAAP